MDYKEAIEEAEIQIDMYESMILYNKDFEPKNDNSNYERKVDFLKTAISAMQELQMYKDNEKRNLSRTDRLMDKCTYRHENGNCLRVGGFCTSVPLSHCQRYKELHNEYTEYKQLGTLKKVRKAVEKQKPKKVSIEDVGYDQYRNVNLYACICPSCGLHIIEFDDDDVRESESDNPAEMFRDCLVHHGYEGRNNYCNRCGKKLDWTEVDE